MSDPVAYPARDVARLIASDRPLMQEYGAACRDGRVQAVSARGKNLVVVHDPAIVQRLEAANPGLKRQPYEGPPPAGSTR